jgi:hypothetical protein
MMRHPKTAEAEYEFRHFWFFVLQFAYQRSDERRCRSREEVDNGTQ